MAVAAALAVPRYVPLIVVVNCAQASTLGAAVLYCEPWA